MKPTVVLLHGLARTKLSLWGLRRHLHQAGYPTWSETYPSRTAPVAILAEHLTRRLERELAGRELIAVTHSLGGVLARHIAAQLPIERILMLAPPNRGSRAARALEDSALFHRAFGPAARDVRSPDAWPVPDCPIAVIAGTQGGSIGSPPSWILGPMRLFGPDEDHDGVVAVSETRLDRMAAFATVPATHTWIMNHRQTRRLVLEFLADGCFRGPRDQD